MLPSAPEASVAVYVVNNLSLVENDRQGSNVAQKSMESVDTKAMRDMLRRRQSRPDFMGAKLSYFALL